MKNKTLTIKVPEVLLEEVKQIAADDYGYNVSDLVRRFFADIIDNKKGHNYSKNFIENTLESLREYQKGDFQVHTSAKDLIESV